MFEKEAEERARKLEESQTLGVYDSDEDYARDSGRNDGEVVGYEEGFKDGAEFGYSKCNEQLTKAKEIIEGLMRFCRCFAQHHTEDIRYKEAEQFLSEE